MSFSFALRPRGHMHVLALPALGLALALGCAPTSGTDDGGSGTGGSSGVVDANGDKVADILGTTLDVNFDGQPDQADVNGDGLLDGVAIDVNGDGIADGVGLDTNGDGIYDAIDTNGDGFPDGTVGGTGGVSGTGGTTSTGAVSGVGGIATGGSTGGGATGGTTGTGVGDIISESLFDQMFPHRNDSACSKFFTYQSFIEATKMFPAFGHTGDLETRKREIAAFFGNAGHETTGGWADAPGGPYAWGLCFKEEVGCEGGCPGYSQGDADYPCTWGKSYHGRGPIQLSYCYNYGPAGEAIGAPLLAQPELLSSDPTLAFEASLWFWMHGLSGGTQSPHDAIVGGQGFGQTIKIINGIECNGGRPDAVADRIGFFERFTGMLGIPVGSGESC